MKETKYFSRHGFETGTTKYNLDVVVLDYAFFGAGLFDRSRGAKTRVLSNTVSSLDYLICHRIIFIFIKMLNLLHITHESAWGTWGWSCMLS